MEFGNKNMENTEALEQSRESVEQVKQIDKGALEDKLSKDQFEDDGDETLDANNPNDEESTDLKVRDTTASEAPAGKFSEEVEQQEQAANEISGGTNEQKIRSKEPIEGFDEAFDDSGEIEQSENGSDKVTEQDNVSEQDFTDKVGEEPFNDAEELERIDDKKDASEQEDASAVSGDKVEAPFDDSVEGDNSKESKGISEQEDVSEPSDKTDEEPFDDTRASTQDKDNNETVEQEDSSEKRNDEPFDDSVESKQIEDTNPDGSKKRFEDYSYSELSDMARDNPAKAAELNADFRERYEAEMRGMTQEEYRDYKSACERYAKEQEAKEKECDVDSTELSKVQNDAEQILDKFREMDTRSAEKYAGGAKSQELKDISDANSRFVSELKDVRQNVVTEKTAVWNDIAKMNYDDTKDSDPAKYQELCDRHHSLEKLEKQLDNAIVKMDMNNWDIAQVTGIEYRDEAKILEKSDVNNTYEAAEKVLVNGVTDNASIMDAYRLGEKLEHDVLPSLDGERRETVSSLTMAEGYRDSYLRENNCTHAEAMSNPHYAENDRYIRSLEAKKSDIEGKMVDTVELATALHDQVPMADSDCKLRVIDNKNGTITIERSWENGGKSEHSHEGKIRQSETTFYRNALEKKDSITMGQNSNSVYAHQFSFQYRGLGFKRESSFGTEGVKLKNSAEGGFLNFNASFGYKRGTEGKMSTLSADANGSLAQFKETASFVVKNKEYAKFSAEVSALKASASAKMDSSGTAKVGISAHIVGGEASANIGRTTVAKISGAFAK